MKQELYKFINECELVNDLSINLIWRKFAINKMTYVRDTLCGCLLDDIPCYVESTHTIKGMTLPIYNFTFGNTTVTMCNDFNRWFVSLSSNEPIYLHEGLFFRVSEISYTDFMPYSYPGYVPGCNKCSFIVNTEYELWTLLYMLVNNIK